MKICNVCETEPILGSPSAARWAGPDGKIEDFEPPKKVKKAAPKKAKA
jgi:hypothetical protein